MKRFNRYWQKLGLKRALIAILLALISSSAILGLFPSLNHLVYDQFLWRFITGPIVADWKQQPVTQGGVVAYAGYNLFNTIIYALSGLSIFYGIYRALKKYEIELGSRFFSSALPLVVFGGLARAGEDLGITGQLGPLFITPVIYLLIAGLALLLILISQKINVKLTRLLLGSGLILIALYSTFFLLKIPAKSPNYGFSQLTAILALATLLTATFYVVGRLLKTNVLVKECYIAILFGHLLDASQSYIGMHSGYTEKMVLPNLFTSLTGPYAIFLLKIGLILPILYLLEKETTANNLDQNFRVLFMLAVIALGLPQGVRGSLRIFLGV